MTSASTATAAARIRRAALWGIGRYESPAGYVHFPVSWQDWERDTAWMRTFLLEHGQAPDSGVVVVGGMPEAPWFDPVETAVRELGSPYCIGEVHAFEAFRTGMYALRLPIGMIFGMNKAVAAGLAGELADVVARVTTIFARPEAVPVLRSAGGDPFVVTRLGPALAVECLRRGGAHVNAHEWSITDEGGVLRMSTVSSRAFRMQDADIGATGTVDATACGCGRDSPRVIVDPARAI